LEKVELHTSSRRPLEKIVADLIVQTTDDFKPSHSRPGFPLTGADLSERQATKEVFYIASGVDRFIGQKLKLKSNRRVDLMFNPAANPYLTTEFFTDKPSGRTRCRWSKSRELSLN
jgi:hypothetical protein